MTSMIIMPNKIGNTLNPGVGPPEKKKIPKIKRTKGLVVTTIREFFLAER